MVRIPNTVKRPDLEYTDEDYVLEDSEGIQYDIATEYDLQAVLKHFKSLVDIYQRRIDSLDKRHKNGLNLSGKKKSTYTNVRKKHLQTINALQLCMEFIEKFQSINMVNMLEYVFLNSKLKRVTVVNMFSRMFGFSVTIPRDLYITKDEKKEYNMFNDDWTPIESAFHKRQKKKNNQKNYDVISYF